MPATGTTTKIDSIFENNGQKGKVQLPATFGAGFTIEKEHVLFGADFETTQLGQLSFFRSKRSGKK